MTAVIITRPDEATKACAATYQQVGFEVLAMPCFAIRTNPAVRAQWLQQPADVWVILSVHALHHALQIDAELKPEPGCQVIAVGPAVKAAWQQHFDHPIQSHPLMNSEGVIELLKTINPASIKIITTGGGRPLIKSFCMSQSISYQQINTYERVALKIDEQQLTDVYDSQQAVVLTATSAGILQHFCAALSEGLRAQVLNNHLVVGASRIAQLAQEMGFKRIHVAASPSDLDMCQCANQAVNS